MDKFAHKSPIKYLPHILLVFGGFILGGILGYEGRKVLNFSVEWKVSVDQLFNFVAGIIVTLFLGSLWQKNYGSVRVEKDLYIENIKSFQSKIDETFELFHEIYLDERTDTQPRRRDDVLEQFNLLIRKIDTLKRLILRFQDNLAPLSSSCNKLLKEIENELIVYKILLTSKEYDEKYSDQNLTKSQARLNSIHDKLFELMVEINTK